MRYAIGSLVLLLGLLAVGTTAPVRDATAEQGPDLIAVIDASGSMYGRINGVFKLHIATDTVDRLAANLPETGRVGVVAYGHRSQQCDDVEALLPLGSHRPEQLRSRLRQLEARGRAPLSAALREALMQMRSGPYPSSLLLIVDGADNCGMDTCAMIRAALDRGYRFEVDVIGLRLDEESRSVMRCVAEVGNGRLHDIRSLNDLEFALGQVLFAALSTGAPEVAATAPGTDATDSSLRTPELISTSPGRTGTDAGTPPVRLSAPEALSAGQTFEVDWSGPGGEWDYVTLVRRGAPEGEYGRYVYTREGNPLTLQAPEDSGGFELRYVDGQSQRTLVRQAVTVTR